MVQAPKNCPDPKGPPPRTLWFAIRKPNGSLVLGANGAPELYPTSSSAARSGKTKRGNTVTPVRLKDEAP